jgi:hypothetical protein
VAGLYHAFRGGLWSRWLAGLAGFAATGFCGFLLLQLGASLRSLSTDSMVAARSGPGLWVCATGSVLAFGTLFLPRSGQQALVHRRPGGGLLAWAADHDSAGLRRGLQAALGVAWLADGALQLQPIMFTRGFVTQILLPATMGNPAGVSGPAMAFGRLVLHDPAGWNAAFAVTQLLLGAGLLWRRTVRAALAASAGWALAVWWLGEGLGGVLGGMASPLTGAPGAVILYALLAVLLWPGRGAGRPGYSVAAGSPLRPSGATLAWLVLWASSAYFLLQPANRAPLALHDAVAGLATGEPGWLAAADRAVAGAVGNGGAAVSIALAAACLAIWVAGENFGGLFTSQATDPSSGPLLILLAAAYWPASRAHAAPASPRPGVTLATHSPAHGGGHGHGRTVAWAGRDARGRGPAAGRG